MGFLSIRTNRSLVLVPSLGLSCKTSMKQLLCSYYILLCYILVVSLRSLFVSIRERKGADLSERRGGQTWGGAERRDTKIKVHYVRKSIFNKRKK